MSNEPSLQDEAARAGWLYYVAGMTQDQLASELVVSRQRAQRLVSRAMAEGLIHVRPSHRIGACLDLEARLRDRFGLDRVRVAPGLGAGADPVRAIAPPRPPAARLPRGSPACGMRASAKGTTPPPMISTRLSPSAICAR